MGWLLNEKFQEQDPCEGFLPLTRSVPFCEGQISGVKRQFNTITAFVDASNVYGSTSDDAHILRTHRDGLLKVDGDDTNLLPIVLEERGGMEVLARRAGDVRAEENPSLTSVHNLWVREHNRYNYHSSLW